MHKFFNPLPNQKVDIDRLEKEILYFWQPKLNKLALSTSFTTAKKYVDDLDYDFSRYAGVSQFVNKDTFIKKYSDGEIDQELIYWPKILEHSYMKELGDYFSNLFQSKHYRVRASYFNTHNYGKDFQSISLHSDPHTPYRLHIAIKTNPNIMWTFVDESNQKHNIHQSADGVPVLIETGKTKHLVMIPKDSIRLHLWYQYYEDIDKTLLKNLLTA